MTIKGISILQGLNIDFKDFKEVELQFSCPKIKDFKPKGGGCYGKVFGD
jgi:hypothetical protein